MSDGTSSLEVIGSDYYWSLVTGEVCRGNSGPIAIHTKLGWVLSGPTSLRDFITTHVLRYCNLNQNHCGTRCDRSGNWNLSAYVDQKKTVHDEFVETITFKGGRYQVALPWKEFHKPLPDHYQLSLKQLWGLLRRLRQNPTVLQEYDRIIQDQLKKGIVEPVSEKSPATNRLHYLPHHAVVRSGKSTVCSVRRLCKV